MAGKFVVVTWPRSGSTSLKHAMWAHPDASFKGDVFNPDDSSYCGSPPGREAIGRLFGQVDGFMFTPHWKDGFVDEVMGYRDCPVRFVVLWRRNVLRAVVSEAICTVNDVWMEADVRRFLRGRDSLGALPMPEIEKMAARRVGQVERVRRLAEGLDVMWVEHAELYGGAMESRVAALGDVFEFVGMSREDGPEVTGHVAPGRRHLSAEAYRMIENVDEIEATFSERHGSLFDGP